MKIFVIVKLSQSLEKLFFLAWHNPNPHQTRVGMCLYLLTSNFKGILEDKRINSLLNLRQTIQFNPVFAKHFLSALQICITVSTRSLSVEIKKGFCFFFRCLPFKYSVRARMQSRCLLLVLLLGWRSLCVLAGRLDGSQFSGGASNVEEGKPGRDGCFFHLHYLCLWWLPSHLKTL